MKTTKKILYICISLLAISAVSGGLSMGMEVFFELPFWKCFSFFTVLQLLIPFSWDYFYESKRIIKAVQDYANLPYKKYMIGLNCAHCGQTNKIEMDLSDTEFKCEVCKKDNGIYVEFMAAAITEPVSNTAEML